MALLYSGLELVPHLVVVGFLLRLKILALLVQVVDLPLSQAPASVAIPDPFMLAPVRPQGVVLVLFA